MHTFAVEACGLRAVALALASLALFQGTAMAQVPATTPPATAGQWLAINPVGVSLDPARPHDNYGINTVVIDPKSPGTLYLGTNYQGIYESTNGGASWAKIDTGAGSSLVDQGRVWALALDPFNHTTLYAASGYGAGGPLKSTDGGVSWTHTLPSSSPTAQQLGTNDIYNVAVDPYTPNHLLASFHYYWYGNQDSGVIESTDGGASWSIHNPPPGAGWGAGNSIWFLDSSHTWLLGSQNAGLWRTTDAGQSWTQVSSTSIAHGGTKALYRNPRTGLLVIATWNGVLRSTDAGQSWQDFARGLPYAAYETVASDGRHLYTAPSFPESTNAQATGPWYTVAEGGTDWTAYNSQTPCTHGVCNGPVDAAFDPVSSTIYTANWNAGAWMLATGAPSATAPVSDAPAPDTASDEAATDSTTRP
jgi:photosystem II stability/assembly factor-like uncharacterized protein